MAERTPTPKPSPEPEPKKTIKQRQSLDTGLADYGKWRNFVRNHKSENDPPFRRGRIWA
jgi:cyanobactin cluster PatC/TenC/TruC protein